MDVSRHPRIPCSHDNFNSLLPRSSRHRKFEIKLVHQLFERLISLDVDGAGQRSIRPLTPYRLSGPGTVIGPFNPFCVICQGDIVNFCKSSGKCDRCIDRWFQVVRDDVTNELRRFLREFYYSRDHHYTCKLYTHIGHVCNDDGLLRAWVERESFEEAARPTPASKASIEALERSIIKDNEDTSCVICFEELNNNKEERTLKVTMLCKHEFHEGCIVEWLHNSHVCPRCRFELRPVDAVDRSK